MNSQEESLIELLLQIRRGEISPKDATKLLRKRLLAVGSASPDNLECASHLEVGKVRPVVVPRESTCIKVRGRPISLSSVLHSLEGARMPKAIRERFPDLTRADWDACLRATTLILLMFEHSGPYQPRGRKKAHA